MFAFYNKRDARVLTKNIWAIVIGLFWIVISVVLVYHFGVQENNWDHTLVVYNAVSSVGFAAIGVLLGVKVQQVDLVNAKADAKSKSNAVKDALRALTQDTGDAGGGTPLGRTSGGAEALAILLRAL